MSRILFLDDNRDRRRWAFNNIRKEGEALVMAVTAEEAIDHLRMSVSGMGEFGLVYLDHDLDGEEFVDSSRPDCGMEVVRWIVTNRPTICEIIVHTINTPAGHEMVRALRLAGYTARYYSFYKMAQHAAHLAACQPEKGDPK